MPISCCYVPTLTSARELRLAVTSTAKRLTLCEESEFGCTHAGNKPGRSKTNFLLLVTVLVTVLFGVFPSSRVTCVQREAVYMNQIYTK